MIAENQGARWIELDGAVNARVVVPGVLLRSENLQALSDRDVRVLVEDEGVEVVLDLRTDVEVALEGPGPMVAADGVRLEHRSLYPDSGGNTDLEVDLVRPWGEDDPRDSPGESPVVRAYMRYLERRPDSIVGAIRAIARAKGAALVHCAAGKDRTGVVVALALDAAGVDRSAIVADYLASGERIDAIFARLLGSRTYSGELAGHDPQDHVPARETIDRLFELLQEGSGGTVAWLSSHGLTESDLQLLRRRLGGLDSRGG